MTWDLQLFRKRFIDWYKAMQTRATNQGIDIGPLTVNELAIVLRYV